MERTRKRSRKVTRRTRHSTTKGAELKLTPKRCHFDRIPDEIIIEIFSILRDWSYRTRMVNEIGDTWVVVTHVCRRWRNLAINHPCLWTIPDLSNHSSRLLEAFLKRSKEAPLTIDNENRCQVDSHPLLDSDEFCRTCKKTLATVLPHLPHIRILNLNRCNIEDIEPALDLSAPVLQELELCTAKGTDSLPVLLPAQFLAASTPSLRRVYLSGCSFAFKQRVSLFQDLTNLILSDHYRQPDRFSRCSGLYPDVDELIHIFEACPNLQEFGVSLIRSPSHKSEQAGGIIKKAINLQHLTDFSIYEMDVDAAAYLFQHVEIPNFAQLSLGLRCGPLPTSAREIPSILHKLCADQIYDNLRIMFRRYTTTLNTFTSQASDKDERHLHLILYHVDEGGEIVEMVKPSKAILTVALLLQKGIWSKLTELILDPGPVYNFSIWLWYIIFQKAPEVTDLRLEFINDTSMHALNASKLNLVLLALCIQGNRDILLPHLKGVTIAYGDLKKSVRDTLELSLFLERRKQAGHRLKYLHFHRCNGEEDVEWQELKILYSQYLEEKIQWVGTQEGWLELQVKYGPGLSEDFYTMY